MVSISLFCRMILSRKSATFWDHALGYGGGASGNRSAFLPWLLWSFRLDCTNRLSIRPLCPVYSLKENRECDGIAVKEGHPPDLRRRNSQNGDRQDRDEAREQGRGSLRRDCPGAPKGLHDKDNETGSTGEAKVIPDNEQKASRRPFWQIAEAQSLMHEVEAVPRYQTRPL